MIETLIFLINLATTLMMTGIVWFVQLIHYPLLNYVNKKDLAKYEQQHVMHTMNWAVGIMIIEVASAIFLLWVRPTEITLLQVFLGVLLLLPIWILTWWGCVPGHCELKKGRASGAIESLTKAHFSRTLFWTLRSLLLLWMVFSL